MKSFFKNIGLSTLTGLLLSFPWISPSLIPFAFIAFVPLFSLEKNLAHIKWHKISVFAFSFFSFLLWNVITCWWTTITTFSGALFYFFQNAFFMSITFLIFHVLANKIRNIDLPLYFIKSKQKLIFLSFIILWLSFEYLNFNWDFSWPWITLGNALAFFPFLAQWYEYTGILGGSLWILSANVFAGYIFIYQPQPIISKRNIYYALSLLLPAVVSAAIYFTYQEKGKEVEVVIVQPNIDPYEEKFPAGKNFIPYDKQLEILFNLSEEKITADTRYVIFPETSYPVRWELKDLELLKNMNQFYDFRSKHKDLSMIVGVESFQRYPSAKEKTFTSRYSEKSGYFDFYNSAVQLNTLRDIPIKHKSKHLPWVESIPLRNVLQFLEPLTIYLGGFGSHGYQKQRVVFHDKFDHVVCAIICYESIYGEYVSEYVNRGAQAIFIITNDGWWKDAPGYKQHLAYDRLRAIETRRSIARSANNGISCIMDQKGELTIRSEFWKRESLKGNIKLNREKTFYVLWGDLIGKISAVLSVLLLSYFFIIRKFSN